MIQIEQLKEVVSNEETLLSNVNKVFAQYNCMSIYNHSVRVANRAKELARTYNSEPEAAYQAGILHDISGVIPNHQRIKFAAANGIPVLPEEYHFPMIIHQKISKCIANEVFMVTDANVLSAIECHTTLKSGASKLDCLLFVADKLEWDQKGIPPYKQSVISSLDQSIEKAAYAYIHYLMQHKDKLKVVHPWLIAAYKELKGKYHY